MQDIFDKRRLPVLEYLAGCDHMLTITHAISIRQPYVELILTGKKRYEYRSTPTNIRGRVYLYAAKKPAQNDSAWRKAGVKPGDLPTGCILGTVEIVWCRWSDSDDCYRYRLLEPKRLRKVIHPKSQPQPKFFRPRFRTARKRQGKAR